jgi:hypothetical protein
MSVTTILAALRRKKTAAKRSTFDAYMDLVRAVASGQEIDADKAAETIEQASKSEESFEKDVETQQTRYEDYRLMQGITELQASVARLTASKEQLQEKLNAAIAKYKPGIDEAFTAIHQLEQQILSATGAEPRLLHSCFDKTLLDRETELIARRTNLLEQRRPLDEDFERAKSMHSTYKTGLANEVAAEAKEDYGPTKSYRREQIAAWRRKLTSNESFRDQLAAALRDNANELEPIQKELKEIHEAKLTP